jgi:hypothetical protein
MEILIEFTGVAKEIAGGKQISLRLKKKASYVDLVEKLGKLYPALIGIIIDSDGKSLLNANFFSRDGEEVIFASQMDEPVRAGEKIILISIIVGG